MIFIVVAAVFLLVAAIYFMIIAAPDTSSLWMKWRGKIKIIFGCFQIITSFSTVLSLSFPTIFQTFISSFLWIDCSIGTVLVPKCKR
jgi:hypothetical protein